MNVEPEVPACRHCGEQLTDEVDFQYLLCEWCESDFFTYCEVCGDFVPSDLDDADRCRHVQPSRLGDFLDCGCGKFSEDRSFKYLKPGLWLYLARTGDGPTLWRALLERTYYFQYRGSMLGPSELYFSDGGGYSRYHGEQEFGDFEGRDLANLRYAASWLISLWPEDDCRKQELALAGLVKEWLDAQKLLAA